MAQPVETTTILDAQPFWMLRETNTLMFFKSVANLCFTGPLLYLACQVPISTTPRHYGRLDGRYQTVQTGELEHTHTNKQTNKRTLPNV